MSHNREPRSRPPKGVHVCIVSPYDPRPDAIADPAALRGGVEEALDRSAVGLAARGHRVTLVSSATRDGLQMDEGVRRVRVKRRGSLFRAPLAPLRARIPRDADVVHVPATYPGVSDWVPLREPRGRAVVVDYHFDVHGSSPAMRVAAALHRVTLGRGMGRATRVVTKSHDYAAASPVLSKVPAERLDHVPNGVDVDEFDAPANGRGGLLFVGRLVPYKGVDVLLRAMPAIHAQTGASLTIVGDGPERARLESLASGLPVRFTGRLPREEVVRAYAQARLSVLPSVNAQEAFGIALLESMASGTPVVASDLPGVREVARLAGLTAPAGDPHALAARVAEAWHDRRFGSPGEIRARVAARYDWRIVLGQMERVYERAITEARP